MKNSLVFTLSACSTHQCLAFAASAFVRRGLAASRDDVLPHASSTRWSRSNAPGGRHHAHQRRQRSLLRAAAEEGGGMAESGDEAGDGNVGAGSGMGLDGEWQVRSGQGREARVGGGVGSVPGQLPEKTRDGQDWAEWAREWREDPEGKANRLVDQWETEAKETGGSQGSGKSKKRYSKKKKKKGGGASRGVVGSGFGGAARPTKSVPKGLVVAETSASAGDVVDWSTGQQLAETDRKENMAADWQQDAKHLESLDPSDREKLAEKLRIALGKKPQKPKKKAPSGGGDARGFSSDSAPTGGRRTKKGGGDSGDSGDGGGRGVLASAAAAAGAVAADDVAGVSVFPSVPAESPAAAAAAAAVAAGLSGDEPLPPDVSPAEGESKGGQDVLLAGAASVGDSIETEASSGVQTPVPASAVEDGETTTRNEKRASPGDEPSQKGGEVPLERVMGFGKGVAVIDASSRSSSVDASQTVVDAAEGSTEEFAESSGGSSVDDAKLSNVRSFGRGVAMPPEAVAEDGEEGGEPEAAADIARLSGFGRGVAFPVENE